MVTRIRTLPVVTRNLVALWRIRTLLVVTRNLDTLWRIRTLPLVTRMSLLVTCLS